ncbi:unnamed protein product [Vicia faba]|uniref:Uncharacterized protein n=1 Tax=Vicia faba TaxID=3906 RepID=A0AAV0Z1R5_VICFA|nr:unnamed protein product [Vicia faba]
MPTTDLRVEDFVQELIAKHESNSYKKMVIYIDANEAGSMFEGHLPNEINVYATTSSVANESSIGFYCPDSPIPTPPEYEVCLGDLYSISWMEDSDISDRSSKTLQQKYSFVRERSIPSHVTKYDYVYFRYLKLKVERAPYGLEDQHNAQKALEVEIAHKKKTTTM